MGHALVGESPWRRRGLAEARGETACVCVRVCELNQSAKSCSTFITLPFITAGSSERRHDCFDFVYAIY